MSQVDADQKVVNLIQGSGGRLADARARRVARLIGGKKPTVHRAMTGPIAVGIVAKAGVRWCLRHSCSCSRWPDT